MESKIYHIEFHDAICVNGNEDKHFYFGSKAAIYDTFTSDQIGITYNYLRSGIHLENGPYSNSKCIIRLGVLRRKENK